MTVILLDTFAYSMLIEVVGALLSAIVLIIIGWGIYYLTQRRQLLAFFNITNTKRLMIYLSNLRIAPGGSIGVDGLPRSFSGTTVVNGEQIIANEFRERFNYLMPSLSDSPSFLSKILFADIQVNYLPSPLNNADIDATCSIITLGSPGYNKVSGFIESMTQTNVKFGTDNSTIAVLNIPPINDTHVGFIQRIVITTDGVTRSLFYVAGLSELGTTGAARYLSTHWKSLFEKYNRNTSFLILLKFPTLNLDRFIITLERAF